MVDDHNFSIKAQEFDLGPLAFLRIYRFPKNVGSAQNWLRNKNLLFQIKEVYQKARKVGPVFQFILNEFDFRMVSTGRGSFLCTFPDTLSIFLRPVMHQRGLIRSPQKSHAFHRPNSLWSSSFEISSAYKIVPKKNGVKKKNETQNYG